MAYFSIPRSATIGEVLLDGSVSDTNDVAKVTYTGTNVTYASCPVGYQKQCGVFGATSSLTRASLASVQGFMAFIYPTANTKTLFIYNTGTASLSIDGSNNLTQTGLTNSTIYVNGQASAALTLNAWNFVLVTHDSITAANWNFGATSFTGNAAAVRSFNAKPSAIEIQQFWHEFNRKLGGGSDTGAYIAAPVYQFDSLGDANDVAGQTATTASNVATFTDDKGFTRYGQANGSNSSVSTGFSNTYSQFSVAFRFKTSANDTSNHTLASQYVNAASQYFWILQGRNNHPTFPSKLVCLFKVGGTDYSVYTSSSINDGNWHTAVLTFKASEMKIYLDGVLNGTPNTTIPSIPTSSYPRNLYLFTIDDTSNVWNGQLQYYWHIPQLLDANQAKFVHNLLSNGYPYPFRRSVPKSVTDKMKVWLPGYISGTTVYDFSGGANNGTASNSPGPLRAFQNQSLSFNGSSQSVSVPNLSGIYGCTMWVKATAATKTLMTYSAGKTFSVDGSYGLTSANLTSPVYYVNNGAGTVGSGSKWMMVTVLHSSDSTSTGSWATSSLTGNASDLVLWSQAPTQNDLQQLFYATYRN